MKKTSTKKAFICLGVLFFLLWSFIVSAITIDPWRFVATMRIQQINLYYRITSNNSELDQDDIVKAWLTNYWWVDKWVLYIRPVDFTGNLVDETNNVVTNPDHASIIWRQMNTNNWDETTILLWWSKNTAGGSWVVLMWWDDNTATVDNAVILWSASSTVWSPNWVVMAAKGWKVYWKNSTIFWGGWQISTWADNSFAIGWSSNINHQWVFSYGWATSVRPNIAQFYGWQWIIVWWTKPNGNGHIKLSVNWALAVWRGQCSNNMIWSIYYKAGTIETTEGAFTPVYCLCACVASGSNYREIALSNQPYCNGVCECLSEDANQCHPTPVKCWTRWASTEPIAYANWEKWWRVASRFCEDNRPPIEYQVNSGVVHKCDHSSSECEPPFPEPGQTVRWTCHWVWYYDLTDCYAYRDVEAPELAECGANSRRYNFYDTGWDWTSESDFCKHLNWGGSGDRAHNGELTAYRTLSEEEVEIEYKSGGIVVPYTTWSSYLAILGGLRTEWFPDPGYRTYWKCVTSNAKNEVWGREITNEKICYADRWPCNICAKDGFPYCFSVDFGDDCSSSNTSGHCLPGTHYEWERKLYVSWNVQEASDALMVDHNKVDNIRSETPNLVSSIDGQQVKFTFPQNTDTNDSKEYKAKITLKTGSSASYCPYWTITISQCPKWYSWSAADHKCVEDSCLGTLAPWAFLPEENKKNLETSLDIFLTWGDNADYNAKCASRCAKIGETYTDRKGNKQVADMDLTFLINPTTGVPFCAKCEEWTAIPEAWYCEFKDPADCMDPYKWFDIDKWKCALPWTCEGIDFDRMSQDLDDIIPIANTWGTPINWSCLPDEVLVNGELPEQYRNQCYGTCKKPYICTSEGTCEEPRCHWNTSNSWQWLIDNINKGETYRRAEWNSEYPNREQVKADNKAYMDYFVPRTNQLVVDWNNKFRFLNSELQRDVTTASFYYNIWATWTVTVKNPKLYWEPWVYVEANDVDEFDRKTSWLKWCFYWCTWSDLRVEIKKDGSLVYYCSVDPNPCDLDPDSCTINTNPGNPGPVVVVPVKPKINLCEGSINIRWNYGYWPSYWYAEDYPGWTTKQWEFSETPATGQPCKYWCKDDFKLMTDDSWQEWCWRECRGNEYARNYVCMNCPSGTYPTTWENERDKFGNPIGCWQKCTASQYISSNGYCYSCGAGRKWNPNNKDSHWNSKDCVNICGDWRTYWTNRDGKKDCGEKNGKAIPNCCLSTYASANYKACDDPNNKNCEKVSNNCVCHVDMTWV